MNVIARIIIRRSIRIYYIIRLLNYLLLYTLIQFVRAKNISDHTWSSKKNTVFSIVDNSESISALTLPNTPMISWRNDVTAQPIRILYLTMTIVLSVVEKCPQHENFACPILVNYRYCYWYRYNMNWIFLAVLFWYDSLA